jgi:protein-tyrosine phosphatase
MADFSRMVDVHCHYLPAVDDGAANLDEGLALVRAAHTNGISRILLTPHIHVGRYENTRSSLQVRFETFRRAIFSANIPVEVALAAEVRCTDELMSLIERDEIPFLLDAHGNKTLLLEMPHSRVTPGVEQFVRWLQKKNITPLLAHPERNKEFIANPQRIADLCSAGCLAQITAAAVVGRFGDKSQRAAHWLLDKNLVAIIATDAHNLQHRPPLLREAAQWVAQRFGVEHAWRLVGATPAALTSGNFYRSAAIRQPRANAGPVRPKSETRTAAAVRNQAEVIAPSKDFCEQAFAELRAQLLGRAAKIGRTGSQAARTLALMNELHVR